MGNEHSKVKSKNGYMAIQTEKQFYYPGDMVTGTIYLRVLTPFAAKHIEIKVKGIEKAKFKKTEAVTEENETRFVKVKKSTKKEFLEFSCPAFKFTD